MRNKGIVLAEGQNNKYEEDNEYPQYKNEQRLIQRTNTEEMNREDKDHECKGGKKTTTSDFSEPNLL